MPFHAWCIKIKENCVKCKVINSTYLHPDKTSLKRVENPHQTTVLVYNLKSVGALKN